MLIDNKQASPAVSQRTVIQIAAVSGADDDIADGVFALRDDGSIWTYWYEFERVGNTPVRVATEGNLMKGTWKRLSPIPQP
jgi:hypothetical protein